MKLSEEEQKEFEDMLEARELDRRLGRTQYAEEQRRRIDEDEE